MKLTAGSLNSFILRVNGSWMLVTFKLLSSLGSKMLLDLGGFQSCMEPAQGLLRIEEGRFKLGGNDYLAGQTCRYRLRCQEGLWVRSTNLA